MLELVLRLFGLLGSLLLLNHGESVFGLFNFYVLAVTLSPFVFVFYYLVLLLVIRIIYSRWDPIISNGLLSRLSLIDSSDTEAFLIGWSIVECFLVIIVQHMH